MKVTSDHATHTRLVSMNESEFHRVLFESSAYLFSESRIGLLLRWSVVGLPWWSGDLPWVCSVIDHRRRQNVVRTTVTYSPSESYHILTSSVIYHWTDARQNGIYVLSRPWKHVVDLLNNFTGHKFWVKNESSRKTIAKQNTPERSDLWLKVFCFTNYFRQRASEFLQQNTTSTN